ncbi:hypothetical protein ALQ73_200193 [Pseudomonas savastanoi pv. glycinea]|uniref:Uncharacterized protein n=1 Tax=Pseudomonas savastanoi pv. glycinea TaxID=318 RepID=A0A3M3G6L8_PSESG|nr:hypothetical protein ALQ73_200193 [Pseudomonas savastanoi pv. glycinea]
MQNRNQRVTDVMTRSPGQRRGFYKRIDRNLCNGCPFGFGLYNPKVPRHPSTSDRIPPRISGQRSSA